MDAGSLGEDWAGDIEEESESEKREAEPSTRQRLPVSNGLGVLRPRFGVLTGLVVADVVNSISIFSVGGLIVTLGLSPFVVW